jgi:DNA mismatch repair protein MutL
MNPSSVDVNVHPAKLEVKFADERSVFEIVYYTVKNALEKHEYRPEMELSKTKAEKNLIGAFVPIGADTKGEQLKMSVPMTPRSAPEASRDYPSAAYKEEKRGTEERPRRSETGYTVHNGHAFGNVDLDKPLKVASSGADFGFKNGEASTSMTPKDSIELLRRYRDNMAAKETPALALDDQALRVEDTPEYKFIGEAFDCYVMVEYDGALLVIDKHAAHERVIFEDLKKQCEADNRIASQLLMLPITVLLGGEELETAKEYYNEIRGVGFEFNINNAAVDITAIPKAISAEESEALFIKMIDEIIEGRGKPAITEAIRREKALYQVACKAAIKGGRVYTKEILHWLIKKLLVLPDITVCPHGRPVAFRLTKNELDRQFERLK